jgi:TatD DNase family protein
VIARARAAGITKILVPGVDAAQWSRAAALPPPEGIALRFAVGVHPCSEGTAAEVEAAIERLGAVAIGELGWDRAAPARDALADALIALAKARALPVVLHVVGRHGHALERLRRHAPLRGVVHAYSGSAELVREYVGLGLAIAIGPSVLREGARKVRAAAVAVPDAALLVETDAPEGIAEPADLVRVIEAVAGLRGASVEAIGALTAANAERMFG